MFIRVKLTNRTASFPELDADTEKKLRAYWSFSPKGLWYMPRYKPTKILLSQRSVTLKQLAKLQLVPGKNKLRIDTLTSAIAELDAKLEKLWDGKISFLSRGSVSAGLFRATWREVAAAYGIQFSAKKARQTVKVVAGMADAGPQYRHQNECARAMLAAIPRGGGIVLAATSSGKTSITARMFSKVACPCLFVVDQLDLLYQQKQELEDWLHELIGVVGDGIFDPQRVTVATIQTLHLHAQQTAFLRWYKSVDIMVVDELHEQMARRNFDVLQKIKPVAIFGLTATLQLNQKETRLKAYAFAGPVIFKFPIAEGVKRGVLIQGYALQLLFEPVSEAEDVDYQTDLAQQVTQNEVKLSAYVKLTEELLAMGRHVLALVSRVQHLHDLDDMSKHIPHKLAYGEISIAERREIKTQFEDEDIKLIIANGVFKKGVSIKRIDAMIDMAEGKSKNDVIQKMGRGLRLYEGKHELLYIDFGTQGHGRFAANATARRRALKKDGIDVTIARVKSEAEAVSALYKFVRKVVTNLHGDQTS